MIEYRLRWFSHMKRKDKEIMTERVVELAVKDD